MISTKKSAHAQLALHVLRMASSEEVNVSKIEAACQYQALKACLEKNNWKKEKCEKEWEEFQTLCATNRKWVRPDALMNI